MELYSVNTGFFLSWMAEHVWSGTKDPLDTNQSC